MEAQHQITDEESQAGTWELRKGSLGREKSRIFPDWELWRSHWPLGSRVCRPCQVKDPPSGEGAKVSDIVYIGSRERRLGCLCFIHKPASWHSASVKLLFTPGKTWRLWRITWGGGRDGILTWCWPQTSSSWIFTQHLGAMDPKGEEGFTSVDKRWRSDWWTIRDTLGFLEKNLSSLDCLLPFFIPWIFKSLF